MKRKLRNLAAIFFVFMILFSLDSTVEVSADTTEINLSTYLNDYDEQAGLVNWENIPVSEAQIKIRLIEDPESFNITSGYVSFNNSGGSIDLTTYTSNELYVGIIIDVPVGSTQFNFWYDLDISGQDFWYIYTNTHVYEISDTTAPIIDDGIFFADVDNPVTMADILATLSATDETDGDVTANIINTADNYTTNSSVLGDYLTTWEVSDSSGNTATANITVRVVDITKPVTTLIGDSVIYVEYLDTYTDPGATCTDNYDVSCTVNLVINEVNTTVLGVYEVSYNATDSSGNVSLDASRTVYVQDTTIPTISLSGSSTIYVEYQGTYTEQGATWTDNYDGTGAANISGSVDVNTIGTYTINYNYTDTNGNIAATISRTVVVQDTTDPVITLTGDSTIYIEYSETYSELGAIWTDNFDGTGAANITGSVDINTLGTYTINYNYTDTNGNSAITVIRTVIVQDTTNPTIIGSDIDVYNSQNRLLSDILSSYVAIDNYDGNISNNIVVTVDNYTGNEVTVGTYTITLSITDSNGLSDTKTFTITVLDDLAPIIYVDSYIVTEAEADAMTQAEIIALIQSRSS